MESLSNAREALESALIHYKDLCLALLDRSGPSLINQTHMHSEPGASFNGSQNISELMDNEMKPYAAFESEATQVKTLLSKARNSLFSLAPINSLPDEILLRIFYLVMDKHFDEFEDLVDHNNLPVHSLASSQVCTRWRQVALGSGDLWSSIDISIRNKTISLGTIFANRSGDLPLNIRVVEPLKRWDPRDRRSTTLARFLSRFGARVESFELAMHPPLSVNSR